MSDARSIAFKLMGRNPNDPSMLYGDDVNRMALNNAIQSDANSSVTPDQAKAASEREMNAYRRAQASIDAVGDGSGQAPLVTDPLSPTGRSRMDRANERGAKFFPSAAASLADPFNIPSAIAGAVDNQAFGGGRSTSLEGKTGGPTIANSQDRPNIRDSWRGVEAQSPGGNIVGGVASGGGVFGAAGKVVKSVPGMMAFGTASGGSSDALDQLAGGRDDAVNSTTVAKMLMGGAGPMPRRVLMGAGAAGVVGGGLLASGAVPSFAAGDPLEAYDKQLQDARGRLTNIEQSKAAAEQALAKQWDKQGLGPKARGDAKAQFDKEWAGKAQPINDEISQATTARTAAMIKAQQKQADDAAAAGDASKRANTRLSDLYPNETMGGQAAAVGAGLIGTAFMKGRATARFNAQQSAAASEAEKASGDAYAAYKAGDFAGAAAHQQRAKAAQATLDGFADGPKGGGIKEALPAIAGLDVAAIGPQFIDHNIRAEPGSDLHKKTAVGENLSETASCFGGSAIVGAALAKGITGPVGSMLQKPKPLGSQGAINAMEGNLNGRTLIDADMMFKTATAGAGAQARFRQAQQSADEARQNDVARAAHSAALTAAEQQAELGLVKSLGAGSASAEEQAAYRQSIARKLLGKPRPEPDQLTLPAPEPASVRKLSEPVADAQAGTGAVTAKSIAEKLMDKGNVKKSDASPSPRTDNGVVIPDTLKPSKGGVPVGNVTYGEQNSPAVQSTFLDHIANGGTIEGKGINISALAKQLGIPKNQISDARANALKLAEANGIKSTNEAAMRELARKLNGSKFGNAVGNGSRFFVGPAIGATGAYVASPDDANASPTVTTQDIARRLMGR